MAWNKYYIFIQSPGLTDLAEALSKLNLGHYRPVKQVALHLSNKPETLFAGLYNGCLLVVHPDLPFQFFTDEQSETETMFIREFPDAEIAALLENSTVDLFGFAVITKGKKIRMKDGCDGEIFHDEGEPLPEELESLSEAMEEMGEELREEGLSEEEIKNEVAFEAAWRVPNLLSKRYLGEYAGAIDTEKVQLTMYEA
jgi:hypothetical protein